MEENISLLPNNRLGGLKRCYFSLTGSIKDKAQKSVVPGYNKGILDTVCSIGF